MRNQGMKYTPLEEEKRWYITGKSGKGVPKPLPLRHHFAHNHVRSKLYNTLVSLGCCRTSSILLVGCGSGQETEYISKACDNIVGVDVADVALRMFKARGFQGILSNVEALPLHSESFDYVIAPCLLHHLVGQGNLKKYIAEFARVTRRGGYFIALEPNIFNLSGVLMNFFNTIKPGITGLVPHERALSPFYLTRVFKSAGLTDVKCIAASYVWNRLPLPISRFIAEHEERIRFKKPFNLLGWFEIVYGQKAMERE